MNIPQQVFYIHGGSAYDRYEDYLEYLRTTPIDPHGVPPERWSRTLAEDLGEGYDVIAPTMPNKYNAKYDEWKIWFERHFAFLHDEVILVGWSLGGLFLAKYLAEHTVPFTVRGLILIAAVYGDHSIENEAGESDGDFAFTNTTELARLTHATDRIVLMHSKDDFVVPYEHAKKYAATLTEAELVTFTDRNHFLQSTFPELYTHIRRLT